MGEEASGNRLVPFVYCSRCRKYQLAHITNLEMPNKDNKRKKFKISIIACAVCDIVQNMERIPSMKWLTYSQAKKIDRSLKIHKYEPKNS